MFLSRFASLSHHALKRLAAVCAALCLAAALCLLPACTSNAGVDAGAGDGASDAAAPAASMEVSLVATAAVDGFEALSASVQIPEGGTIYDALLASGWDCSILDSEYGKFIDALGGVATGDGGPASGWVYLVNNETVMDSVDGCVLAAGDEVEFDFYIG